MVVLPSGAFVACTTACEDSGAVDGFKSFVDDETAYESAIVQTIQYT